MAKKHLRTNGLGDVIPEVKGYKAKPKPYQSDIIEAYIKARDRVLWKEASEEFKKEIEERYL